MNIYLIDSAIDDFYLKELSNIARVKLMSSGKKIGDYNELFNDSDVKILGLNPNIIEWEFPTEDLKRIKNLKGIASKSSWINYIDLEYCKNNNLKVLNIAGANSESVAEHAVWMMLSLARNISMQIKDSFHPKYDSENMHTEIFGKSAGIVGLGRIGNRIANMLKGMGLSVNYWSPKTRNSDYVYKPLDDLLKESDFIFNCVEICEETNNLLNKDKLCQLKNSTYFISILGGMGWGPEDDKYLIEMVNEKKISGFAVEGEHKVGFKVPEIKKDSNIFIPGAYAFYTKEAEKRSNEMWVEAIKKIAASGI